MSTVPETAEVHLARRALQALYLEVPAAVADDVSRIIEAAFGSIVDAPVPGYKQLPEEPTVHMIMSVVHSSGAVKIPLDQLGHKPNGMDIAEGVWRAMWKAAQ